MSKMHKDTQTDNVINAVIEESTGRTMMHVYANSYTESDLQVALIKVALATGVSLDIKDKAGLTPLHIAAAIGNWHVFNAMVEHDKKSINFLDAVNVTPLEKALAHLPAINVITEQKARIATLIEKALNKYSDAVEVNATTGRTLLHFSAIFNDATTVSKLLAQNFKLDASDKNGLTPLSLAAIVGNIATFDAIVDSNAEAINYLDTDKTPLMQACAHIVAPSVSVEQKTGILKLITHVMNTHLEKLDLSINDPNGHSYLSWALEIHRMDVSKCTEFAQAIITKRPEILNHQDNAGKSCLHWMIEYQWMDMVEFLIINGAEYPQSIPNLLPPLWLTTINGLTKAAIHVLKHYEGVDTVGQNTTDGNTLLHYAASKCQAELTDAIIANEEAKGREKALVNVTNAANHTPLMEAALANNLSTLKSLLTKGASTTRCDDKIHHILYYIQSVEAMTILRDHPGSQIAELLQTSDTIGMTPLHHFIQTKNFKCALLAVEMGVKCNTKTTSGKTPLCLLLEQDLWGNPDIAKTLISELRKHDASASNTTDINAEHQSALDVATAHHHDDVLELLGSVH